MKQPVLSELVVFVLVTGSALALASLLAPPGCLLLFLVIGVTFGLLSVGVLYVKRSAFLPGTQSKIWKGVALGVVALLAFLLYLPLHSYCIVWATRPEYLTFGPVTFPLWLNG